MSNKPLLTEDTLVVFKQIPVGEYRKYFVKSIGEEILSGGEYKDFQTWLFRQGGKTLKEATEDYFNPPGHDTMEQLLTERRFHILSEPDKQFIIAFDREIGKLGYDFGGGVNAGHSWGSRMTIIYGKTGTKSRPCPARIHIRDSDILFQIYFTDIDQHRQYIEAAPAHIKEVFTVAREGCKACRGKCGPKEFTIDGQFFSMCRDAPFWFANPSVDKLPDYMGIVSEFYGRK